MRFARCREHWHWAQRPALFFLCNPCLILASLPAPPNTARSEARKHISEARKHNCLAERGPRLLLRPCAMAGCEVAASLGFYAMNEICTRVVGGVDHGISGTVLAEVPVGEHKANGSPGPRTGRPTPQSKRSAEA
jgi:hypothetical protein